MSERETAALVIFLATVAGIVARPSRVPEWLVAVAGVIAMLIAGVLTLPDAWQAIVRQWDVLLFFAGLMTVVAVAESAGFFAWVAYRAGRSAGGSTRRLFAAVMIACSVVAALLTNDAASLVMTPLVFTLTAALRLQPLPFAFACTFIANSASLLLPISNPVNIMIAEAAGLTLARYLALLWLPALVALAATGGVLWAALASLMRGRFAEDDLASPAVEPHYVREVQILLSATAISLIATSALSGPVGLTACAAALVLVIHGALRRRLDAARVISDTNATIIIFVAALFALTQGVAASGLLSTPLNALVTSADSHPSLTGATASLAAAAASNLFNNLPTAALAVAALHHATMTPVAAPRFAAGAILGCDIGPNLTTVGSLSTILWLVLLRRRGLNVSSLDYLKLGLLVAPITLALAIGALAFTSR